MLPYVAIRDVRFLNEFVETARVLGMARRFAAMSQKLPSRLIYWQ